MIIIVLVLVVLTAPLTEVTFEATGGNNRIRRAMAAVLPLVAVVVVVSALSIVIRSGAPRSRSPSSACHTLVRAFFYFFFFFFGQVSLRGFSVVCSTNH